MKYFEIKVNAGFCGTNDTVYEAFEDREDAESFAEELCQENAESYAYLINGWGEDYTEEEYEEYLESCEYEVIEISKEEYEEQTE